MSALSNQTASSGTYTVRSYYSSIPKPIIITANSPALIIVTGNYVQNVILNKSQTFQVGQTIKIINQMIGANVTICDFYFNFVGTIRSNCSGLITITDVGGGDNSPTYFFEVNNPLQQQTFVWFVGNSQVLAPNVPPVLNLTYRTPYTVLVENSLDLRSTTVSGVQVFLPDASTLSIGTTITIYQNVITPTGYVGYPPTTSIFQLGETNGSNHLIQLTSNNQVATFTLMTNTNGATGSTNSTTWSYTYATNAGGNGMTALQIVEKLGMLLFYVAGAGGALLDAVAEVGAGIEAVAETEAQMVQASSSLQQATQINPTAYNSIMESAVNPNPFNRIGGAINQTFNQLNSAIRENIPNFNAIEENWGNELAEAGDAVNAALSAMNTTAGYAAAVGADAVAAEIATAKESVAQICSITSNGIASSMTPMNLGTEFISALSALSNTVISAAEFAPHTAII